MAEGREEGLKKGLQEGRQEAKHELLLRLLTLKFGPLPEELVQRLRLVRDEEVLDMLAGQILTAQTLAEFRLPALRAEPPSAVDSTPA